MSEETSRCVERAAVPAPEGIRGRVIRGALWWLRQNWLFHVAAAASLIVENCSPAPTVAIVNLYGNLAAFACRLSLAVRVRPFNAKQGGGDPSPRKNRHRMFRGICPIYPWRLSIHSMLWFLLRFLV